MLVVCVALAEEITMIERADAGYLAYRERTPFMLPLPRFVSQVFTAPNRIVMKKEHPGTLREVLYTFVVYTVILVALSLPVLALNLRF